MSVCAASPLQFAGLYTQFEFTVLFLGDGQALFHLTLEAALPLSLFVACAGCHRLRGIRSATHQLCAY